MKTIKVSEATNTQLDWLVAKCEGRDSAQIKVGGPVHLFRTVGYDPLPWQPTTDWSQMGPIIDRERISVVEGMDGEWQAGMRPWKFRYGPTPLIAAARCYVVTKLGDTVEVPDEL